MEEPMSKAALRTMALALLAGASLSLGAQSLADIAGSWQGDKVLGTVFIKADGTGEVTFEADSRLKMAVKVTIQGGQYVVAQAEPNKPAFYQAFKFGPNAAARISKEARPMKWIFALSADRARLNGKKETTGIKYTDLDTVTAIDNSYVRDSVWTRLTGKVAAPAISLASGSYPSAQAVTLSCATPGAVIRYSLDGSAINETAGLVYSGPISVAASATLVAVAVKDGWQVSDAAQAEYKIAGLSMKAKWREFDIELVRCFREGNEVTVEIKATNMQELTRWFGVCRWKTRLFGDDGNMYDKTEAFFAGQSAGMGTVATGELPSGVPVKLSMKFSNVPASVKSIKLLELQVNNQQPDTVLSFKDVPIAD